MSAKRSAAARLAVREEGVFCFSLFVVGSTPSSARAIVNVRKLCEQHLAGRYQLEVTDLSMEPAAASRAQVVAAPTLLKHAPPPVQRFIGDMSNGARILDRLGVKVPAMEKS